MEDQHYPNQQIPPGDQQPPDDPPHPSVSPAIPEPRKGQRPCHPRIMPDSAYGNCPPVEIERDLQQGGDPNQDQKLTNEEDLGDLYSVKFLSLHCSCFQYSKAVQGYCKVICKASIPTGDGICLHTFRPRNLCSLSWSGYYHSCHLC